MQGFVSAVVAPEPAEVTVISSLTLMRNALMLAVLAVPGSALAETAFNPLGDGSGTNNADLLRDPTTGCENCQTFLPHEWDAPPFKLDWSVSLRGAYVQTNTASRFEALLVPTVAFRHDFLRGTYSFDASTELSRSSVEDFRVNSLRLGTAGEFRPTEALTLKGAANLAVTTPSAASSGYPTGTLGASQQITGDVAGSASYDFGLLTTTLRGDAARSVYGPTRLVSGGQVDNSANDNWRGGAGLRIGYKVTPILTAFVDGGVGIQTYDKIAPAYGVRLDATDTTLRGGLSTKWSEVLEAEASIGLGWRHFTYGVAPDLTTALYDASLTFRPDETLTMRGALSTKVGAPGPNASGVARVDYALTGTVDYQINPWVKLRGSAGYSYAVLTGTTGSEAAYTAGAGADYLLNEHMSLTGDYGYALTLPSGGTASEEHRVTVGATLKR